MGRQPNGTDSARIYLRASRELASYLDDLVKVGIYGQTSSEVAKALVGREIERLIRDGILKLHGPEA